MEIAHFYFKSSDKHRSPLSSSASFLILPELLFTAPVFADRSDLAVLERIINMAYFDDRVRLSSAFSLPKHYAIVARGNWVAP